MSNNHNEEEQGNQMEMEENKPRKIASKFILPERKDIEDKYLEAWYELGAPILIPFIKFSVAVGIYFFDCFFLIKNTVNAIRHKTDDIGPFGDPRIIAPCLLGLHVLSSILISVIDSLNKDAIAGSRGKYLSRKYKGFIFLRWLAHLTLTMRLFRLITAYLENRRRNKQLHILRMRRTKISEKELKYVVDQKRNQLVESHYDLVDSFFKTVPATLLQVFLMAQNHPDAKLRIYTTIDQDRLATIFFTIISASISATNYQADYLAYKKVLRFEDCFRSGFKIKMNLTIPGDVYLVSNYVNQLFSIGIRMCFYSALIFWSPVQFVIVICCILGANYCLVYVWNKSSWRFRPVLDNPLHGIPWPGFDLIDLWINLFVPGVHYPKPLDHLLNFYTTVFCGIIVFGTWDFLFPTKSSSSSSEISNSFNATTSSPIYAELLNRTKPSVEQEELRRLEDPAYIVWTVVKHLLVIHEYLTLHEISYQGFFFNVVKFINVVNLFCFIYTCILNWAHIYDLDFPIQIANSFYHTMFKHLEVGGDIVVTSTDVDTGAQVRRYTKSEVFLVYSLLSNSVFFYNVPTLRKKKNWSTLNPEHLDALVSNFMFKDETLRSPCYEFWHFAFNLISPILYPGRLREAKFPDSETRKTLEIDKTSIISEIDKGHPLREEMVKFVDQVYDKLGQDGKLLLRIWCSNYNEIVTNYTSLRIRRTFEFLDIPIERWDEDDDDRRTQSGNRFKHDYEMGYLRRIIREARAARGLVDFMQL